MLFEPRHFAKRLLHLSFVALCLLLTSPSARTFQKPSASKIPDTPNTTQGTALSTNGSKLVQARRGTLQKTLILDGELRAVRSRSIDGTTSDDVKLTYLPPEGSIVKPGDRLVEMDNSTILNKIKDVEEKIIAADNEIGQTEATHQATLRDMSVEKSKLWLAYEQSKIKARIPVELIARREYQENQLALEKSRTEFELHLTKIEQRKKEQAAELEVKVIERRKLNAQLDQAKNGLEGLTIKAPIEGMVLYSEHWDERRKVQVGDLVWGGFPILSLPDLREMEVMALVNEVDGPKLAVGQKTRVILDSYPKVEIPGAIREISQTATRATSMGKARVFKVAIKLNQTVEGIMKPGMSAQITVSLGDSVPGLIVPRTAVRFEGGSATVQRIEQDQRRRPLAVTILAGDASFYLVADNGGLKVNDSILARAEN